MKIDPGLEVAVDAFIDAVSRALIVATASLPDQDRGALERSTVTEAFHLACGFIDADGLATDDELWALIGAFGRRLGPDFARSTPDDLRADGATTNAARWLTSTSDLFEILLGVDRRQDSDLATTYYEHAMALAHMVASLDTHTGRDELLAIDAYRGLLLSAIKGTPAATPPPGGPPVEAGTDERSPDGPVADGPPRPLEQLLAELDGLVGLAEVKREVKLVTDLLQVQRLRRQRGLPVAESSRHLIFTGNPGTGKTTVARLLAQIYRTLGVVSRGHLVETDRAGLVAGYVGQTATRVTAAFDEADQGVLLIDEAYALVRGSDTDFGREAIDTIVKLVEDRRDRLVVIAAGYPDEMADFIDANPGLPSRFPRTIAFPDYDDDELTAIFAKLCVDNGYGCGPDTTAAARALVLRPGPGQGLRERAPGPQPVRAGHGSPGRSGGGHDPTHRRRAHRAGPLRHRRSAVKRLVAIVAAVAMVAGALYVRSLSNGDGSSSGHDQAGPTRGTLVCATELAAACATIAQHHPELTVRTEEAQLTLTSLAAAGADPTSVGFDAWLVPEPWPDMANQQSQQSGSGAVLGDPTRVVARSPLVIAAWNDRRDVLQQRCGGVITWKCIGEQAGTAVGHRAPAVGLGRGEARPPHPGADRGRAARLGRSRLQLVRDVGLRLQRLLRSRVPGLVHAPRAVDPGLPRPAPHPARRHVVHGPGVVRPDRFDRGRRRTGHQRQPRQRATDHPLPCSPDDSRRRHGARRRVGCGRPDEEAHRIGPDGPGAGRVGLAGGRATGSRRHPRPAGAAGGVERAPRRGAAGPALPVDRGRPMNRTSLGRAVAVAVVAVTILAACSTSPSSSNSANGVDVGNPGNCLVVNLSMSSEKIDLLTSLAQAFNKTKTKVNGTCVFVNPKSLASGAATDALANGWDEASDGPSPVIWTPASSAWGAILDQRRADQGQPAMANQGVPFMNTPLVIAMPQPMAEALGWPAKALGWSDILDLAKSQTGWAQYGHPEWGPFRLGKTNPNFSTSGLSALIAQNYAATGKTRDLTLEDLAKPETNAFDTAVESAVNHYGDTTLTYLNNWYRADQEGTALQYTSALAVEEKSVIDYNTGNPDGKLDPGEEPRPPRTKLVAIYPKEGTVFSDNPLFVLDAPWVNADQKAGAQAFIDFVQQPDNQERVLQFNFRPGNPQVAIGAPITADNGVDPNQPQTLLQTPRPPVLVDLLNRWSQQRKAARVLLVIDISGSMKDRASPDSPDTKLDLAKTGRRRLAGPVQTRRPGGPAGVLHRPGARQRRLLARPRAHRPHVPEPGHPEERDRGAGAHAGHPALRRGQPVVRSDGGGLRPGPHQRRGPAHRRPERRRRPEQRPTAAGVAARRPPPPEPGGERTAGAPVHHRLRPRRRPGRAQADGRGDERCLLRRQRPQEHHEGLHRRGEQLLTCPGCRPATGCSHPRWPGR